MTQAELFKQDGQPAFACTGRMVEADCLSEKHASISDTVSTHIAAVAMDIARRVGHVSADDLHAPDLLKDRDGRVIGAVLKSLVRAKALKPDGYVASRRAECHARPIVRFVVA